MTFPAIASARSARELLASMPVWDNHACLPLRPDDESFMEQLWRFRAGGVDVASINVGFGEQGIEEHVRILALFRHWLSRHTDRFVLATSVADIEAARATGRLAVCFDIEGANAVADQPSLVQLYYDLGVRWMLLAYNRNSRAAGGCHDEDSGLTPFGRKVIDQMERVGMVLCCAHAGERSVFDIMAYSRNPVVFSHSCARAVFDHPRNITDAMIRACAATGGVVGVNGIDIFVGKTEDLVGQYVRHILHIADLVGTEHVGIGTDYVFDTAELEEFVVKMKSSFPAGMGYSSDISMIGPERMEDIVERLQGHGFADEDLRRTMGGNLMRIARQVWKPTYA
ncbi:dipeptidase [Novosphingobium sp. AP12]|uniref:dipeptidase n=1 Tax=Novosphingobium sp. AP12 TaxID=1144305 RepID=UPI000272000B|nr:membrane dipeptidase [Novosphingobium sp. AP12]EJL30843.1 Zn-dependent dipeptidase, microsomal dipeptidase [Novosphingobium sp. AP12]